MPKAENTSVAEKLEKKPSYKISPDNYSEAMNNNQRFYIQFHFFTPEVESLYMKMLHRFLEKHDILYLKEMILTILRELITNAVKANTKRLYFKLNNLDIKNQDDYRKGMEKFKGDVYGVNSDIFDKLQDVNLIVRVLFESIPGFLRITITNNIPLLKVELKKSRRV